MLKHDCEHEPLHPAHEFLHVPVHPLQLLIQVESQDSLHTKMHEASQASIHVLVHLELQPPLQVPAQP